MRSTQPVIVIVSPGLADANNGNWHTAWRWQAMLAPLYDCKILSQWRGEPADILIALHARRSADSVARFAAAHPARPLVLVLTGTDVYRDIRFDLTAVQSLQLASHLVVLQEQALLELSLAQRRKCRLILPSALRRVLCRKAAKTFDLVALGHLRAEKDPLTLMRAVRQLPASSKIRLLQIGAALDAGLAVVARQTMAQCPRYHWLGGLAHPAARRWLARSQGLVHASLIEGGATVIAEALQSAVPVIASKIEGNIGMLGLDYAGYFSAGDATGLAAQMLRFESDESWRQLLQQQAANRAVLFDPSHEMQSIRALINDLLETTASLL